LDNLFNRGKTSSQIISGSEPINLDTSEGQSGGQSELSVQQERGTSYSRGTSVGSDTNRGDSRGNNLSSRITNIFGGLDYFKVIFTIFASALTLIVSFTVGLITNDNWNLTEHWQLILLDSFFAIGLFGIVLMKFKFNVTGEKLQTSKEVAETNSDYDHKRKMKTIEMQTIELERAYQIRLAELDSFWKELVKLLGKAKDNETKEILGKLIEAYIIEKTKGSITPTVLTNMERNLHEIMDRVRTIDMATDLVEELKKIDVGVAKETIEAMEGQLRKDSMNKKLLADMLSCPECGWIIVNKENTVIEFHQSTFEHQNILFIEQPVGKNILMFMSENYPIAQQIILTEALTCAFTGEHRKLNFAEYVTGGKQKTQLNLGFYPFYGNGDISGVIILIAPFDNTSDESISCDFEDFELNSDIPKTEPEVSIPDVEEINPEKEGGEE
jgi:hypothetical protein